MENKIAVSKPEVVLQVERELLLGNLVVILGGVCSGKSWLINKIFDENAIVDKKLHALRGDNARICLSTLAERVAKTESAIAIDEVQLLDQSELIAIIDIALSCKKGVVIAAQQEQFISEQVIRKFLDYKKQVVFIEMEFWRSGLLLPDWKMMRRISSRIVD